MTDVDTSRDTAPPDAPNPMQDRTFLSTRVVRDGAERPLVEGTRLRLTFSPHRVGAHAGCNTFDFPLVVRTDRLVTGEGFSTLMACDPDRMAQDAWMAGFLGSGPRWRLDAGRLVLTGDDAVVELVDDGGPSRPLWGRDFEAVEVHGAPSPPVAGSTIDVTFSEPDRMVVSAGCNTLSYAVRAGDDGIVIGPGAGSTEMACAPDLEAQDRWIDAFLSAGPAVAVAGNTVVLTGGGIRMELRERAETAPELGPDAFVDANPPAPPIPAQAPLGMDPVEPLGEPDQRFFRSVAVRENGRRRPLAPGTAIELTLGAGRLSANAGCNALSMDARLDDGRLVTGPAMSTLMGCSPQREAQDRWLLGVLAGSPRWVEHGGRVTLSDDTTTIELVETGPEAGTEPTELWGLTFVSLWVSETGIVPAPVVDGTEIRLTFTAPDGLTAHAGCNTLGFRIRVGPDRLVVDDDVASTRMACPPDLQARDEWLAAFFTADPEYGFTGLGLTLTRGGTEIVLAAEIPR